MLCGEPAPHCSCSLTSHLHTSLRVTMPTRVSPLLRCLSKRTLNVHLLRNDTRARARRLPTGALSARSFTSGKDSRFLLLGSAHHPALPPSSHLASGLMAEERPSLCPSLLKAGKASADSSPFLQVWPELTLFLISDLLDSDMSLSRAPKCSPSECVPLSLRMPRFLYPHDAEREGDGETGPGG